jgi:hypothetical protein
MVRPIAFEDKTVEQIESDSDERRKDNLSDEDEDLFINTNRRFCEDSD